MAGEPVNGGRLTPTPGPYVFQPSHGLVRYQVKFPHGDDNAITIEKCHKPTVRIN